MTPDIDEPPAFRELPACAADEDDGHVLLVVISAPDSLAHTTSVLSSIVPLRSGG
jgi:hypothetical protein